MAEHATEEDFNKWERKAKLMTDPELSFSLKDCFAAAKNLDKFDPIAAGRYMDEGNTYFRELCRRRNSHCI